jgi:hypothetical protein
MDLAPLRPEPDGSGHVRIWFRFEPRAGWLPFDTEILWATDLGDGTARIESPPFLQDGVAVGDVVRFRVDEDGDRWGHERVRSSGHCLVRVLPDPAGPLGPDADAVRRRLAEVGVAGEAFSADLPLIVCDIPAGRDVSRVKELLRQGETEGWWYFETGSVTDEWRTA